MFRRSTLLKDPQFNREHWIVASATGFLNTLPERLGVNIMVTREMILEISNKADFYDNLFATFRIVAMMNVSEVNFTQNEYVRDEHESCLLHTYLRVVAILGEALIMMNYSVADLLAPLIYLNARLTSNMMKCGLKSVTHPCMMISLAAGYPETKIPIVEDYLHGLCGVAVSITGIEPKKKVDAIINTFIKKFDEATTHNRGSSLVISAHSFYCHARHLIKIIGSPSAPLGIHVSIVLDKFFLELLQLFVSTPSAEFFYYLARPKTEDPEEITKMWKDLESSDTMYYDMAKAKTQGDLSKFPDWILEPILFSQYLFAIITACQSGHGIFLVSHTNMLRQYKKRSPYKYIPCLNLCHEIALPSSRNGMLCSLAVMGIMNWIPLSVLPSQDYTVLRDNIVFGLKSSKFITERFR